MQVKTKEFRDMVDCFEKLNRLGPDDREQKQFWPKNLYKDGRMSEKFLAFMDGYSMGRCVYLETDE